MRCRLLLNVYIRTFIFNTFHAITADGPLLSARTKAGKRAIVSRSRKLKPTANNGVEPDTGRFPDARARAG